MIVGGFIALLIAAIGAAYAGLVIRAAPHRRDNVMFGLLAATDAATTAWRGVNALSGVPIVDASCLMPCAIGTIVMALLSIEFMYSFPRQRAMPWPWRAAMLAWAGVAVWTVVRTKLGPTSIYVNTEIVFFLPATLVTLLLGARAWRRTTENAAHVVIAALGFRWIFGFAAYFVGPLLHVFEAAVWAETTFATMVSFVVIGTAVLRSDLFSIRSAAAEVVTIATICFFVALGGAVSVIGIIHWTDGGNLQDAMLVGATFVPLALAGLGRALYPRLEKRVLSGLDERRGRRLALQDELLSAEPTTAIAEAKRRISVMADGATVTWQPVAQVAPELADLLRTGEPSRLDRTSGMCFAVPALGGDGALVGAFQIGGGTIDRDTYMVARDLGARVALSIERHAAVSELEDARRLAALGQFAAAIAHDIRTPLTSISLNVQILRQKLALPPDDREHLDIALEELGRLDKSVAEILDFAKPVKLVPQTIDVGELIEATARKLSPLLSEKGLALRCEPSTAALPPVQGDPQRLRQVLVNLVDNAADASAAGGAVTVRAKTADAQIAIEIEDHGRGIDAEDLPRIFEPFFTTRPDGTGLGLAICHKVIRAHGGDIQVRSTQGGGSTFTVLLPAA
ncbi:MAG: ATP-binding protein [Deltaproteobacteria bacterium]